MPCSYISTLSIPGHIHVLGSGSNLCLTLGEEEETGGLRDGSPPVGSRGRAPVGGLGTKTKYPRSCKLLGIFRA